MLVCLVVGEGVAATDFDQDAAQECAIVLSEDGQFFFQPAQARGHPHHDLILVKVVRGIIRDNIKPLIQIPGPMDIERASSKYLLDKGKNPPRILVNQHKAIHDLLLKHPNINTFNCVAIQQIVLGEEGVRFGDFLGCEEEG